MCFIPQEFVLSIGGFNGKDGDATVEFHDLQNNSWKSISSLNKARGGSSACLLGQQIYVIGGGNKEAPIDSIESLSVEAL